MLVVLVCVCVCGRELTKQDVLLVSMSRSPKWLKESETERERANARDKNALPCSSKDRKRKEEDHHMSYTGQEAYSCTQMHKVLQEKTKMSAVSP